MTATRIQKHAEEIFWLERRILFLKVLNQLLDEEPFTSELEILGKHYAKIETPGDIVKRLKEIYGENLQ